MYMHCCLGRLNEMVYADMSRRFGRSLFVVDQFPIFADLDLDILPRFLEANQLRPCDPVGAQ